MNVYRHIPARDLKHDDEVVLLGENLRVLRNYYIKQGRRMLVLMQDNTPISIAVNGSQVMIVRGES